MFQFNVSILSISFVTEALRCWLVDAPRTWRPPNHQGIHGHTAEYAGIWRKAGLQRKDNALEMLNQLAMT